MILPRVTLFPQAMLPLYLYEPRYRQMLADSLDGDRMFAVAMQRSRSKRETPARVAGLGLIRAAVTGADGTSYVILQGIARIELRRVIRYRPYRLYQVHRMPTELKSSVITHALASKVLELVSERIELGIDQLAEPLPESLSPLLELSGGPGEKPPAVWILQQVLKQLAKLDDPEQLADVVSATLLPEPSERQIILETRSIDERLRFLVGFLLAEIRHQKKK